MSSLNINLIEKTYNNLSIDDKYNSSIYHQLNNKTFLFDISKKQSEIDKFDNLTQGYIYYLFLKNDISLPFDDKTILTSTNYLYYFAKYKRKFSLEQLILISKYYDEKSSSFEERKSSTLSLNNEYLFSEYINYLDESELKEVDDIIFDKKSAIFKLKFDDIISSNNGKLTLKIIVEHEEFFIEAISFCNNIKESIIYTSINENFNYSDIVFSDEIFDVLAPFLIKNISCNSDYKFKNRFFIFLTVQSRNLFNSLNDSKEEEAFFIFSLINKFKFTDEPEHVHFLTNLIENVSKYTPEFLFNVFNIIDLDVEDRNNFIFQLTFPIFLQKENLENHPYSTEQFIENKDFIRDTLQDDILENSRFLTSNLRSFLNKYFKIFDFRYLDGNFMDEIFSQEFSHFLLNLKGNNIFSLFSYSFNDTIDPTNRSDRYFIKKYIEIIINLHFKTKDLFEDYFNNQQNLNNLLMGYAYNILPIKENILFSRITNIFEQVNIGFIAKDDFNEILSSLNKFCYSNHIFNEFNFFSSISLDNIDYDKNQVTYSLDLPSIDYLHFKEFAFGGSIGVFSKQYFHNYQDRIQENLISYFLFFSRQELLSDFEVKPTKNLLNNMLPPGTPIPSNKTQPVEVKSNSITLHEIFDNIFLNNDGLKKQSIQRFLFVFYFNNQLFDFVAPHFQDIIRKEINIFLFKNYSFDHGYNFSKENIRVDFYSNYQLNISSRNSYIKLAYLLSSPKFSSQFLVKDLQKLSFIFSILPENNKFLNNHITQLLKSFYLNLSMIIDFKISQYNTPYYKQLFQTISKVLLVELFETNFQRFKMSDVSSTDILNYLFANHKNLNIQKLQLYPEVKIHIKELGYQIMLSNDNEVDNNFVFLKKSFEGFKKFFILSLFISDNNTVSDIIQTFYSNKEIHILQELLENNNLMFNLSPQVFNKDIIENTISPESIKHHITNLLDNIFISGNKFHSPSPTDLADFINIVSETSYLYKYGFITQKIKLPQYIEDNINDFLSILFEFNDQNLKFTQTHINLFNIFDFNINSLKSFFFEKYPFVFITRSIDTLAYQFDLFSYFSFSKEEMLSFIKKTFSDINNPLYFDILFDFNKREPLFLNWIKSLISEQDPDIINKQTEEIYFYFWENSEDCPELRTYLLKLNLLLTVFSYDIENIVIQAQERLEQFHLSPIYQAKNFVTANPAQYYLFYNQILSEKLKFSNDNFKNLLKSISNKYYCAFLHDKKIYIKSMYIYYLSLMENIHYNSGTNFIQNYLLVSSDFRKIIIDFYGMENELTHFLFYKNFNFLLPHETNLSIIDLTTHLQSNVNVQNIFFNFQLNILNENSDFMSIIKSFNNSLLQSYNNLDNFFNFILNCIIRQSGGFHGSIQTSNENIKHLLEFIMYNLRLVDFLKPVYITNHYSILASSSSSLDYARIFRQVTLFNTITEQSTKINKTNLIISKKKI